MDRFLKSSFRCFCQANLFVSVNKFVVFSKIGEFPFLMILKLNKGVIITLYTSGTEQKFKRMESVIIKNINFLKIYGD